MSCKSLVTSLTPLIITIPKDNMNLTPITGCIYKHTCTINNKTYIGQTIKTMNRRFTNHITDAKANRYPTNHFHKALRKYPLEAFTHTILEDNIPQHLLDEREVYYIKLYDSYKSGYNSDIGGKTRIGFTHTVETKQKISSSLKGKQTTPMTDSTRSKISSTLKGRKLSKSHIANMPKIGIKNPNFKPWGYTTPDGIKHTMTKTTIKEFAASFKIHEATVRRQFSKPAIRGMFKGYVFSYINMKGK